MFKKDDDHKLLQLHAFKVGIPVGGDYVNVINALRELHHKRIAIVVRCCGSVGV